MADESLFHFAEIQYRNLKYYLVAVHAAMTSVRLRKPIYFSRLKSLLQPGHRPALVAEPQITDNAFLMP
jgi:hypothetical protein